MKFDRVTLTSPRVIAFAIAVMSCGSRDASVGCSPTPSCSLNSDRFEPPPPIPDAGRSGCDVDAGTCPATHVAAGREHSCAISPTGELLCWGNNAQGQLGISIRSDVDAGAASDAGFPFVLENAKAVAAGDAHTCAIDVVGAVHCWGRNTEGQVNGVPSAVVDHAVVVDGVTAGGIAAGGAHSCALSEDGVWCWGSASHGQVGRAVMNEALEPALVTGTEGAVGVSTGTRHSCALFVNGTVICWGELFDGDSAEMRPFTQPIQIADLNDARQIAAGAGFTCALRPNGSVVCFGDNGSGQLGDGTTTSSATPVDVTGLTLSLQVAAGGGEINGALVGHACAITHDFLVQCWGRNHEGQLASDLHQDIPMAVPVRGKEGEEDDEPLLPNVIRLAAGGFHSCAIDFDGPVLCWGDNTFEQLGIENPAPFGRPVEAALFSGDRRRH